MMGYNDPIHWSKLLSQPGIKPAPHPVMIRKHRPLNRVTTEPTSQEIIYNILLNRKTDLPVAKMIEFNSEMHRFYYANTYEVL